jgi:uroporphyrinogen-III synthase
VTEHELRRTLERLIPPEDEAQAIAALDARMRTIVREEVAEQLAELLPRMQELASRVLPIAEPNRRAIIRKVAQIYPRMCSAYFRELDAHGLRTKWGESYMEASRDKDKRKRLSHEKDFFTKT